MEKSPASSYLKDSWKNEKEIWWKGKQKNNNNKNKRRRNGRKRWREKDEGEEGEPFEEEEIIKEVEII